MKSPQHILPLALALCALSACQKTLDLDYDTRSPLLVVEGAVSDVAMTVRLTYTSNVADSLDRRGVEGAIVSIEGSDGFSEQLVYGDGRYYSPSNAKGVPGVTYTLSVAKNDTLVTATSTMPKKIAIDSLRFRWMKIVNDVQIKICQTFYTDDLDAENYLYIGMTKNGEEFHWTVVDDTGWSPLFNFTYSAIQGRDEWEEAEKDKARGGTIQSDVVYNGDRLKIELRTIDRPTYDYFYTSSLNKSTAIDPETNLQGDGCVGYFSAYTSSVVNLVFDADDETTHLPDY